MSWKRSKIASYLLIPYLVWVSIAVAIYFSIAFLA
ncbi:tryptophan-rich sensory protein [Candidatus Bathyarchaeota archaeon]|nr:tryptophan-rich sensory protein [Candidatus Bathyarchaeota archaeon]